MLCAYPVMSVWEYSPIAFGMLEFQSNMITNFSRSPSAFAFCLKRSEVLQKSESNFDKSWESTPCIKKVTSFYSLFLFGLDFLWSVWSLLYLNMSLCMLMWAFSIFLYLWEPLELFLESSLKNWAHILFLLCTQFLMLAFGYTNTVLMSKTVSCHMMNLLIYSNIIGHSLIGLCWFFDNLFSISL